VATTRRTGRRPGNSGSREAILDAARRLFAARGYDGASLRAIAGEAGVDPGLLMHFFGSKEGVFVAAMELPYLPSEAIPAVIAGGPPEATGERVARFFVETWDATSARSPLLAMIRSATTSDRSAELLRGFLEREVVTALAGTMADKPDAALRASVVGSQMVGLAMARYVVGLRPLAGASADEVVATIAPGLQRLLVG
jgi:AcrR family transcriptional regulator